MRLPFSKSTSNNSNEDLQSMQIPVYFFSCVSLIFSHVQFHIEIQPLYFTRKREKNFLNLKIHLERVEVDAQTRHVPSLLTMQAPIGC